MQKGEKSGALNCEQIVNYIFKPDLKRPQGAFFYAFSTWREGESREPEKMSKARACTLLKSGQKHQKCTNDNFSLLKIGRLRALETWRFAPTFAGYAG